MRLRPADIPFHKKWDIEINMNIKRELEKFGLASQKRFSQNFLNSESISEQIVSRAKIDPTDIVIEIGTGLGILTASLAKRAAKVITFEIDKGLILKMSSFLPVGSNIELISADFLKCDLTELQRKYSKVKVVSNLPFHISTEVMFKLFEHRKWIETMTLMFQKDVAERIVSKPQSKEYGILSVLARLYSDPKIVLSLSPDKFYPPPDVSAAVVYFQMKRELVIDERHELFFIDCVKSAFGQRRKMLFNSLQKVASSEVLKEAGTNCGIDFRRRAETLSLDEFKKAAEMIYSLSNR